MFLITLGKEVLDYMGNEVLDNMGKEVLDYIDNEVLDNNGQGGP